MASKPGNSGVWLVPSHVHLPVEPSLQLGSASTKRLEYT